MEQLEHAVMLLFRGIFPWGVTFEEVPAPLEEVPAMQEVLAAPMAM